MKKHYYLIAGIVILISGLWLARREIYGFIVTEHLNEILPGFELQDLDGQVIKSSQFAGKLLVIDFWNTWCGACVNAFPEFQKVFEDYKHDPRVAFLAINTSRGEDTVEKVRAFLDKYEYSFPVAYDKDARISDGFEIKYLPTLFIVGQMGRVRLRHIGYSSKFEEYGMVLREHIDKLLNASNPEKGSVN